MESFIIEFFSTMSLSISLIKYFKNFDVKSLDISPYSVELGPSEFSLFLKIKRFLKQPFWNKCVKNTLTWLNSQNSQFNRNRINGW